MRAALLVMAALALLPAAARAQVQPARHDSTQAQIEAMQGMMGPMMGQMMQSMMEGTLRVLAKPETADQLATFTRNYYDALIRNESLHKTPIAFSVFSVVWCMGKISS